MSAKIQQIFSYSTTSKIDTKSGLSLATCVGTTTDDTPYFDGQIHSPYIVAPLLLANAQIAMTRFYTPPNMVQRLIREADPVITVAPMGLRFESFSQCCGVYASTFIEKDSYSYKSSSPGTTNVDFNAPMRAALSKIRSSDDMNLQIGQKGIELVSNDQSVIERKVKLPIRWIKGFMESQSYLSSLDQEMLIEGPALRQFLTSLPNTATTRDFCYLVKSRTGIRQTQKDEHDAIAVAGIGRLHLLKKLARKAKKLIIYGNKQSRVSAFELHFNGVRFQLLLSPSISRGFSGEGQLLKDLAQSRDTSIAKIKASLNWNSKLTNSDISQHYKLNNDEASSMLSHIAREGIIGYDLFAKYWYKRNLPFVTKDITHLQPRLKSAQRLIDKQQIKYLNKSSNKLQALIGDVPHKVDRFENELRCTCEWYSKHKNERGPCKHILAVHLDKQDD